MLRLATRLPTRLTTQSRPPFKRWQPALLPHLTTPQSHPHQRTFANSPTLYKKKDKGSSKKAPTSASDSQPSPSTTGSEGQGPDPFDLSHLQTGISTAVSRLKDDLSKLRAGGRFNTATLEGLKVQLSKDSADSFKLGDLAQVVPKGGRMVTILAAEEEHIKPISSSIISSNLSLTPQADPHNPLQLNIPIPPPTKESRDQSVTVAKAAFEKAATSVRDARGSMHKRLQDMQKKKTARPDDVRNATVQMEKVTEKGHKEVKDLFDGARKMLETA